VAKKVIDTRDASGRGLKYTAYDTKLVDYAKAPKTAIDNEFKIGKPKTIVKPGDVQYFGEEFKSKAEKLAEQRMAAWRRNQTNEYIRAGAKAPGDRISEATSGVKIGQLRGEGFTQAQMAGRQAQQRNLVNQARATLVATGETAPTSNLRVAGKRFQSLAGTAAEGLTTFRTNKDKEDLS
jgi:hypothetical protein